MSPCNAIFPYLTLNISRLVSRNFMNSLSQVELVVGRKYEMKLNLHPPSGREDLNKSHFCCPVIRIDVPMTSVVTISTVCAQFEMCFEIIFNDTF